MNTAISYIFQFLTSAIAAVVSSTVCRYSMPEYSIPDHDQRPGISIPTIRTVARAIQSTDDIPRSEELLKKYTDACAYCDFCSRQEKQYETATHYSFERNLLFVLSCIVTLYFKTSLVCTLCFIPLHFLLRFKILPMISSAPVYEEKVPQQPEKRASLPESPTAKELLNYFEAEERRFCRYGNLRNNALQKLTSYANSARIVQIALLVVIYFHLLYRF